MVNLKNILLSVIIIFPTMVWAKKQVVVILSESQNLELKEGKSFKTGNYLNELTIPLMAMIDAGYVPVYSTPTGNVPHLDPDSVDIKYFNKDKTLFKRAQDTFNEITVLKPTKDLLAMDLADVAGVFIPGGHAPMIDLVVNKDLGAFLRKVHTQKITTALICHGPIALLSAMDNPQGFVDLMKLGKTKEAKKAAATWIYKNYQMTIFSNEEEKVAETGKLKGRMPYYPQEAFNSAQGKVVVKKPWSSSVVSDRELITAQNPNSVDEFTKKVLSALK